ncbi:tyrosine-type recombinase/integrase [Candidatus Pacearchaeota archaeon]|nr:tyrosine-type recombinase/integrase [Candidatus Pacearchaeota archaeon]
MKRFKSFLAPQFENYFNYRLANGFEIRTSLEHLKKFDHYLREKKPVEEDLPPLFFLQMRTDLTGEARSVNNIISSIRVFFHYLVRLRYCQTNPLQDVPPLKENTIIPFVFSSKEVNQILKTLWSEIRTEKQYFMKDFSCYLIILMLARCGLRISEPLRMQLQHYRSFEKSIYIEKTKFKKDRLIPVPRSVAIEIENYLSVRDALLPEDKQSQFLFVNDNGRPLNDNRIRKVFHLAVNSIGLSRPRQVFFNTNFNAPTPHSLRHSFAVNTLKSIKERGGSPQNALPILATYLGHTKYRYTVEYLKVLDAGQHRNLVNFAATHGEQA